MGFLLLGIAIVVSFLIIWNQLVMPAWNWSQDQWHYGDSRITQLDANVGHGGMSHFIAEYSRGEIVVIELSYANLANNHIYTLNGMLSSDTKPVVLLSVAKDVRTGCMDLVIDVQGSGFQTVLYNTGTGFSQSEG